MASPACWKVAGTALVTSSRMPTMPEDRRGINAFAAGFVVERDVAAGDGRAERGAGFGDAVDGGGKLGHDLRLFGIAEVEAVGGGDGRGAGAGDFARGFGDGVHGAEFGIEVAPAAVAVERHGEAALVAWHVPVPLMRMTPASPPGPCTVLVCTMESYCSMDPALGADVGSGEELLEVGGEVARLLQLGEDFGRRIERDRRAFHVPTGR